MFAFPPAPNFIYVKTGRGRRFRITRGNSTRPNMLRPRNKSSGGKSRKPDIKMTMKLTIIKSSFKELKDFAVNFVMLIYFISTWKIETVNLIKYSRMSIRN